MLWAGGLGGGQERLIHDLRPGLAVVATFAVSLL